MKNKILALTLAIVMLLGILPMGALAEEVPVITVTADGIPCDANHLGTYEEHPVYKTAVPAQAEIAFTGSGEDSLFTCRDLDGTFCREDIAAPLVLDDEELSVYSLTDEQKTRFSSIGIDFTEGEWFCILLQENAGPWMYVFLERQTQPALAPVKMLMAPRSSSGSSNNSVTIYMTVSKENDFYSIGGTTMALEKITVPYFDLALYGLENFYYNPDVYTDGNFVQTIGGTPGTMETADGIVTALHAFIYVTEVYYNSIAPENAGQGELATTLNWNGLGFNIRNAGAGAIYNEYWGSDFGSDATYWVNYEFPVGLPAEANGGWAVGATADQIALQDGDILINRTDSYEFDENYMALDGFFHYFIHNNQTVTEATVTQGDPYALGVRGNFSDMMGGGLATQAAPGASIYVTANNPPSNHSGLTAVGYADDDGNYTLDTTNLEPGVYYVTSDTRSPAAMILTVEAAEVEEPDVTLNKNSLTLTVGDEAALTANVEVSWTSSAPDTVSVDASGKVTALKEGTATITASAVGGTKSAVCQVTVNPIPVEFGDFNGDGMINLGDVTDAFNAYMNEDELTAQQSAAADTNSNGTIELGEVTDVFNAYMDA